jgi:hypothetical protein
LYRDARIGPVVGNRLFEIGYAWHSSGVRVSESPEVDDKEISDFVDMLKSLVNRDNSTEAPHAARKMNVSMYFRRRK